jgi:hypothetical protein
MQDVLELCFGAWRRDGKVMRQAGRPLLSRRDFVAQSDVIPKTRKPALRPVGAPSEHWRNRWQVPSRYDAHMRSLGCLPLGDGTWLGFIKFPTREAAETYAATVKQENRILFDTHYLGAEPFPNY